ncbi:MAG TPA: M23 family metallopeptidase [Intrasporangium sp.]|uniref:M23 family metallopeptidase n=1 Tax=Intrasporangium sp. TaxID=1925024 RepID=UPI002D780B4A|nr:M23 family metallopeptidase [Intrasporangium sp.]HET7398232.1 M23 family metallopeptidase [Intrasporangium sp.]
MSHTRYTGRHRPAPQHTRSRRIVIPAALLGCAVVGAVVVRDVGASPLGVQAGAVASAADAVSTGWSAVDASAAVAAAAARADSGRVSRDSVRAGTVAEQGSAREEAAAQQAAARAQASTAKAAADKAAADKAAAAKAAAAKAAAAKPAGVGGGTGNPGPDRTAGPITGDRRWVSPFSGYSLTSGFGPRWGKMHNGQDLAAAVGTPVRALSSGKVLFAGWDGTGYGNFVKIQYWDGTVSWYAHNSRLVVSAGDSVSPGQTVSYSGNTGNSTGPHLHLEIHPGGGAPVAPRTWLSAKGINL